MKLGSKEDLLLLFLFLSYFASRLYGLTLLPIFVDEGIHIQWASAFSQGDLESILAPLYDGKFLQVLLTAFVVPWSLDPLWASRFINVLCGLFTLWGCYEIGRGLFNRTIGLISAGLYIICPFALFYDRMALADGILSTFSTLTLLWSIAIVRNPKKEYVWLLGISIALGILTKIPGMLLLLTPLIVWLCIANGNRLSIWRYLKNVYLLAITLAAIPIGVFFWKTTQIAEKSAFTMASANLLQQFSTNIKTSFEWLCVYWTLPVVIFGMIGFIMAFGKKRREAILLTILVLFQIAAFAGISRILFPRYILFVTVPFLILASWSVTHLRNILEVWGMKIVGQSQRLVVNVITGLLFSAILFFPARRIDYYLWTDPSRAPLPRLERVQYVEEWPSGYGVKEAVIDLLKEAERHPEGIVVVHHELADTTHFGLKVYLMREPRINLQRLDFNKSESFLYLTKWAYGRPAFIVLSKPSVSGRKEDQPDMERILSIARIEHSYPKPGGERTIEVYRVEPNSKTEKF